MSVNVVVPVSQSRYLLYLQVYSRRVSRYARYDEVRELEFARISEFRPLPVVDYTSLKREEVEEPERISVDWVEDASFDESAWLEALDGLSDFEETTVSEVEVVEQEVDNSEDVKPDSVSKVESALNSVSLSGFDTDFLEDDEEDDEDALEDQASEEVSTVVTSSSNAQQRVSPVGVEEVEEVELVFPTTLPDEGKLDLSDMDDSDFEEPASSAVPVVEEGLRVSPVVETVEEPSPSLSQLWGEVFASGYSDKAPEWVYKRKKVSTVVSPAKPPKTQEKPIQGVSRRVQSSSSISDDKTARQLNEDFVAYARRLVRVSEEVALAHFPPREIEGAVKSGKVMRRRGVLIFSHS